MGHTVDQLSLNIDENECSFVLLWNILHPYEADLWL
jgi:hypothetical protein